MKSVTEKKHLTRKTFAIAKENEKINDAYMFHVQGYDFIGFPKVLSPKLSPSTAVWKKLPININEKFLEIGCGTGVFSIIAAKLGASKVTATDINPHAVENTLANARLHNVESILEAYQSDIFNNVPHNIKYDLILWNIPWLHTDKKELSLLEQATFDPNFTLLERYLSDAKMYLVKNGRLLVGYSSTYGDLNIFYQLATKYLWNVKMLYQVGSEETFFAELFELTV